MTSGLAFFAGIWAGVGICFLAALIGMAMDLNERDR